MQVRYLKCEYPPPARAEHGELVAWHSRQSDFDTNHFDCLSAEHRIPRRCKMSAHCKLEED